MRAPPHHIVVITVHVNATRELHVTHVYARCSPPPSKKVSKKPSVNHIGSSMSHQKLKFSKLSEFSNDHNSPHPHTLITVYGSHTGINVYAHCPLHLPKKVTEKPSVNHIGSSTSHQRASKQCSQSVITDQYDLLYHTADDSCEPVKTSHGAY